MDNEMFYGTSIPSPSEVAVVLEELAPVLCHQIKTGMAFSKYICGDKNLKTIRVHPRFELFTAYMMTPPYQEPSKAILHVDPMCPEYEMHLVFDDHVEILGLKRE